MQARIDTVWNASKVSPIRLSPCLEQKTQQLELARLCDYVKRFGFAVYEWDKEPQIPEDSVNELLLSLSLSGSDDGVMHNSRGLSLLQDLSGEPKGRFPPYQPASLKWHTDGYYNAQKDTVRCFTLHCIEPAAQGGALNLMDDTLLVWALLQENPDMVRLLAHPQAMTLPANTDQEGHNRPDRTTAMINRHNDGAITLRFTTRARHIRWRCGATQAAANAAAMLINRKTDWHSRVLLKRGQGIITRNILHSREAFTDSLDGPKRQMLRGRFYRLPQADNLAVNTEKNNALR